MRPPSFKQQSPLHTVRPVTLFGLAFCAAAFVGCAKHESSITGTVTLDGVPLSRGTVTFHPQAGGAPAYARIDAEGNFTVKTGAQEGLESGKYVATVVATAAPGPGESETAVGRLLTPPRYGTVEQSDLEYMITTGNNEIDLRLKSQ
ncbi:MAG: carboxypeptidase-like regulatory domain-containing protein [Pirellulales bacterium]